jgi:hypothetical protein
LKSARKPTSVDLKRAIERLVGEPVAAGFDGVPDSAMEVLQPKGRGIGYSQLNELLLFLGFDRVSRSFFQFLVDGTTSYRDGSSIRTVKDFERGVERQLKLALLLFGNVKHAFKALARNGELLRSQLDSLREVPTARFRARHEPIRPIEPIRATETYFLGYIIERELADRLKTHPDDSEARTQEEARQRIIAIGKRNQDAYLASDHLDVYVATSMRRKHEYLAVNRLGREIFSHRSLGSLKLRWFDPTQAYCKDRIDKGLSEALMLKRALCTIYLIQESDTLGKDSELASTLAQGKPVIAFVPEVDELFAQKLIGELKRENPTVAPQQLILEQLQLHDSTAAWTDRSVRAWLNDPTSMNFTEAVHRLQAAIKRDYDGRARTLKDTHPLGVQVHLETGVANGVLVVRKVSECAELVRRIMTRALTFDLDEVKGSLVLREKISGCVFRTATANLMLTNAFWNFYLQPAQ